MKFIFGKKKSEETQIETMRKLARSNEEAVAKASKELDEITEKLMKKMMETSLRTAK